MPEKASAPERRSVGMARLLRPAATLLVATAAFAAETVPRGPHQLYRELALAFEPNYG
jgi:hypothetical protein